MGEFDGDLFGATMAISNEMEPHVDMLSTTTVELQILKDYSTIFLFRPTPALRQFIDNDSERQVELVVLGGLWLASEPVSR